MLSCYVLARTTTALASTSIRLAPPPRKPRRKRRSSDRAAHASGVVEEDSSSRTVAAAGAPRDVTVEVDEVERLLAETATRRAPLPSSTPAPTPSIVKLNGRDAKSAASSNEALTGNEALVSTQPPSVLSSTSALHFKAVHQATAVSPSTTHVRGGPTHAQQEQIERRRSKLSLAEAEFEVGVTERLVPELPRLPALHETHYGDAVVRELDRSTYFALREQQHAAHVETGTSTVMIDGESCVELSLDNDMSEADFEAFDAEAATKSPAASLDAPPSPGKSREEEPPADATAAAPHVQEAGESDHAAGDVDADADADAVALPLTFGTARPWFIPASGVVAFEPTPPVDCARLLRFLLYLRQQTEADLVPTLRRALQQAEADEDAKAADGSGNRSLGRHALTLADVTRYLDTAPPPVIGFTESLPTPPATSPAFVFHLYLENVSSQNAIGHLAAFFGLPQRCFQTHSAVSKFSCSTVLCAVAENRLRREHLLLLNTLRHPGFVLRVSSIQEVSPDRYACQSGNADQARSTAAATPTTTSVSQQLFGELARWQPLYQTELLLRRVCSDKSNSDVSTRQQLEHRLRVVQTLGAICFCANREASLARAATDILHGFFKSALLNALQRRKAPMPLQRFLKRPNVATAQHAHHVSTDATVRQVLKTFVQTNGDWRETVVRTPYVWRRRWINALRGLVWNTMASQRLRKGGREVCIGDVVLKREFRQDVHRRGIITVKAEHVMVVTTPAEAEAASLEDVCIPFLRGRYPEHLFAPEATRHPIMTRSSMLALLRSMHAPQLLLGLTDEVRLLLDVRAELSPLLFRRLTVRPVEMEFAILEDKPPMRALHYDAARLLTNDRWAAATASQTVAAAAPATPCMNSCHLIPPSDVLERTTLGARLTSGVLAEEFFSVPSPEDYVVLGHAYRHLSGGLVSAAPHSNTADIGDRVYTVYIRAVVDYNLSGLSTMLRECFLLSGIETEADSALQHRVHRMRRELDPETPLLTAPVYCTTCLNRDHDTQEQCAEFQYKAHRRAAQMDSIAAVAPQALALPAAATPPAPGRSTAATSSGAQQPGEGSEASALTSPATATATRTVRMRWHLRRRNHEQRWGVHLTKRLQFVGVEDARLILEGAVWSPATRPEQEREETLKEGVVAASSLPDAAQGLPWPASWITEAAMHLDSELGAAAADARALSPLQGFVQFLNDVFARGSAAADEAAPASPAEPLHNLLAQSPVLLLPSDPPALQLRTTQNDAAGKTSYVGSESLKACPWTLALVNAQPVTTQRDVAAALLQHTSKARDLWLTFESHVDLLPGRIAASPQGIENGNSNELPSARSDVWLHSTHAADRVPDSTAALPPKRRQEAAVAMRAAVQRTSAETQRWLQGLPYRVTLVLVKQRRHLHEHRSWGLQLDGTDMTLVNFARLMAQYVNTSNSVETQLLAEHATVASLIPTASFPRDNREVTARLFAEVLPNLEPLLNDMYRVVRINNTAVRGKAEAARAMAAFQASLDEKLASATNNTAKDAAESAEAPAQFFLALTLEKKRSSYRLCAAAPPDAAVEAPTTTLQSEGSAPPSSASAPNTDAVQVDAAILEGLATPHCPVRPLTVTQLTRSSVTLAINRLQLTEETRNKWGLRLQRGTRRLKAVRQDRHFSFHVFAAKQSQGTRIADTLRLVSTRRPPPPSSPPVADRAGVQSDSDGFESTAAPAATAGAAAHVITRSFYLYFVEGVNQRSVYSHAALRRELHAAAQPPSLDSFTPSGSASGAPPIAITSLPPESLTLSVRQFPLLRFTATVRRGGVGEGSALGPVGMQVDKNMCVLSVVAGSPMARALTEAVGPLCSARRLIEGRSSEAPAAEDELSSAWRVIALPHLRVLMAVTEEALLRGVSTPSGEQQQQHSQQKRRQWVYELDEDDEAAATAQIAETSRADHPVRTQRSADELAAGRASALRNLVDAAAHTLQQLGKCSMVDGVQMLQTSLLHEYAVAQLDPALRHGQDDDARAGLAALKAQLSAVYAQVRWEVVYAAQSNRPLRTPADLAAAFAPGVAEETVSFQQFVED
ncbi:hypothetical protein ABL78_5725 [Leptomonas seymouri]|uniref:Uncharacterized protein n=1 Tax=Leptomonas seymouri TaxID=5684 RepID=A0A0N0P4U2_LEPSE|nr:hypothetical protein ABL78_5725 [Leptomonas seymouri]|eukprot:KPI85217.1 hypothetical protein ABL78_5725 [Leptomonas seymouri]